MPSVEVPEHIMALVERLHTQDDRATANPIFLVRDIKTYPTSEDFAEGWEAVSYDGSLISPAFRSKEEVLTWIEERLDEGVVFDEDEEDGPFQLWPILIDMVAVAYFFTEEEANRYLQQNRHNLKSPDVYADSMYRMWEMVELRKWLMSLKEENNTMTEKLRKMCIYFGRMGKLEGLFFATDEQMASLVGKTAHFGDALGKHSDVSITFDEEQIKRIETIDLPAETIPLLKGKIEMGYNPLDYIEEEEDEEW